MLRENHSILSFTYLLCVKRSCKQIHYYASDMNVIKEKRMYYNIITNSYQCTNKCILCNCDLIYNHLNCNCYEEKKEKRINKHEVHYDGIKNNLDNKIQFDREMFVNQIKCIDEKNAKKLIQDYCHWKDIEINDKRDIHLFYTNMLEDNEEDDSYYLLFEHCDEISQLNNQTFLKRFVINKQ